MVDNSQVLLTTRLSLRRFCADDEGNLFALDSDPEVMRFLSGGEATPLDVIRRDILPCFLSYDEHYPAFGFWAADERASGVFVGWFSLLPKDGVSREATLGYRLRRAAWGKGYATEGARALIRLGFSAQRLTRVYATTYQDNLASRRVMEKVGMTHVRSFRPTAQELVTTASYDAASVALWDGDEVEYVLTRAAWERDSRP